MFTLEKNDPGEIKRAEICTVKFFQRIIVFLLYIFLRLL